MQTKVPKQSLPSNASEILPSSTKKESVSSKKDEASRVKFPVKESPSDAKGSDAEENSIDASTREETVVTIDSEAEEDVETTVFPYEAAEEMTA